MIRLLTIDLVGKFVKWSREKKSKALAGHQKRHSYEHKQGSEGGPLENDPYVQLLTEENRKLKVELENLRLSNKRMEEELKAKERFERLYPTSAFAQMQPQAPMQIQPKAENDIASLSKARVYEELAEYYRAKTESIKNQVPMSQPTQPSTPTIPSPDTRLLEELKELRKENERLREEYRREIQSLKESLERKEKEELKAKIESLEKQNQMLLSKFDEAQRSIERAKGYQSDEVRFLAEGLREGISILKERKPMSDIVRVLEKMSEQPPQKKCHQTLVRLFLRSCQKSMW